jgi:ATP-dependent 26S proteasome regulatory subunit
MDWIEEFVLKRLSQKTNCFVMETEDPKRVSRFEQIAKNGKFKDLLFDGKTDFDRVLAFDIQRGKTYDLKTDTEVPRDPMKSLMDEFDSYLQNQRTLVIVKYVTLDRHAETLTDWLTACAYDDQVYEKKSTIVVFTSNARLFSDTTRRFVHTITVYPSTQEEREALLKAIAKQIQAEVKTAFDRKIALKVSDELIQSSAGLTLHDIETAALESFHAHRKFAVEPFSDYKIGLLKEKDVRYVMPERGFESVGGYDYLKQYIQNNIIKVLRNPDIARHYGLRIPRGIILYGTPGCGKTFLAKALAKEVGLAMIEVSSATFMRGIVGETETRVTQLTALIESLSPIIVFIDEIDEIALRRDQALVTDSGVRRSMQNLLMKWLGDEKRQSFIVGATNLLESCDPAFYRAGRIDEAILVLPPDLEARKQILQVHTNVLRKVPLEKDVNLCNIAEKTFLFTGGELEKLVLDASRTAMKEESETVKQEHFETVLEGTKINVKERQDRVKQMITTMEKLEIVNQAFLNEALKLFAKAEKDTGRLKGFLEFA